MGKTAKDYERDYTDPELRERLKEEIKAYDRGGRPGTWSARKSQVLAQEYERQGGGYEHPGEKTEAQRHLDQWTHEEWQTRDGSERARVGDVTKRYLPKEAWERMTPEERAATDRKKRQASRRGRQRAGNTEAARRARKGASAAHIDDMTVQEAARFLRDLPVADLRTARDRERATKGRKTLLERIERELAGR
jgi:hypothetical protein